MLMTTTNETSVAQTIINQLPRTAFAMMGAKDLMDCGDALQFKVGQNGRKVTAVRIVLDRATDTYTVETFCGRGLNMKPGREFGLVHADALAATLTAATGLYLSL